MVFGIVYIHLIQLEWAETHLDHRPVRGLLHGVLIGVKLDLSVLTDRAVFFPQEQAVEALQVGDPSVLFVQEYLNEAAKTRVESASVLSFQSFGEFLRWNSHFHGLFLEGGFDQSGNFVYIPFSNLSSMTECFRRRVSSTNTWQITCLAGDTRDSVLIRQ